MVADESDVLSSMGISAPLLIPSVAHPAEAVRLLLSIVLVIVLRT